MGILHAGGPAQSALHAASAPEEGVAEETTEADVVGGTNNHVGMLLLDELDEPMDGELDAVEDEVDELTGVELLRR